MQRTNYQFEKRQKDLQKKRKREEKLQRKLERKNLRADEPVDTSGANDENPPSSPEE